jgi:hypothetical protein
LANIFILDIRFTAEKPARITLSWCWWLTPIILATQKAEIRRVMVQSQTGQNNVRPYLEKIHYEIGLVEWVKV